MKICPQCSHAITQGTRARKFCCKKCRDNFQYQNNPIAKARIKKQSLKYYHKISKTAEYKKMKKAYMKGWVKKNRESHNLYMKAYMKKYYHKQNKRR